MTVELLPIRKTTGKPGRRGCCPGRALMTVELLPIRKTSVILAAVAAALGAS